MTNLQLLEKISQRNRFLDVSFAKSELTKPLKSTIDELISYLGLDDFIGWYRYEGKLQGPFVISLRGKFSPACEHETSQTTIGDNLIIEIAFVPREFFELEELAQKIDEFLMAESKNEL
ncbi:hypothetical protein [Campylobacter sp. RM16188]|uniref:hypothetical protein n=1 Tax=Campylobacter sp. RM16188 TaxID=1705725 RepID=UPI001551EB4B|nr:hypothetical protein [Campylobacter sp. RM16188]